MNTVPRPRGAFLAQFYDAKGDAPWNTLESLCRHVADQGGTCVQIPAWESFGGEFNLKEAARSKDYCQNFNGKLKDWGLSDGVSELAAHIIGQCRCVHPAYFPLFAEFAPPSRRGSLESLSKWSFEMHKLLIPASANFGLTAIPDFLGSFLWPYMYPWPQAPAGLVKEAHREHAKRWNPIFSLAGDHGVDIALELHAGEDNPDLDSHFQIKKECGNPTSMKIILDLSHVVLQGADPYQHVLTAARSGEIAAIHIKDAEFIPSGMQGCYGAGLDWKHRTAKFRTPGRGQINYAKVKTILDENGCEKIAWLLEWEDPFVGKTQGLKEGLAYINAILAGETPPPVGNIETNSDRFDNFAGVKPNRNALRKLLGLKSKK